MAAELLFALLSRNLSPDFRGHAGPFSLSPPVPSSSRDRFVPSAVDREARAVPDELESELAGLKFCTFFSFFFPLSLFSPLFFRSKWKEKTRRLRAHAWHAAPPTTLFHVRASSLAVPRPIAAGKRDRTRAEKEEESDGRSERERKSIEFRRAMLPIL